MTYSELKKRIKQDKQDELVGYISYMGDHEEYLTSNFIENCKTISDNQLIRAEKEGLLRKELDTYFVNK